VSVSQSIDALEIDGHSGQDVTDMGFRLTDVAGASRTTCSDRLRDGSLDPSPEAVQGGKFDGGLALARGLQGAVLRLRTDRQGPAQVLGPPTGVQALGAAGTDLAIRLGELDFDDVVRALVDGRRPTDAGPSGWTRGLLSLPVDGEVGCRKALPCPRLPLHIRSGWTNQLDLVVALAAHA
jgi:hypothetical protein